MSKLISYERTTGMGARHCTQILLADEWVALSDLQEAKHLRRDNGFEVFELEITPDVKYRAYHRSNSGNENIIPDIECLGF